MECGAMRRLRDQNGQRPIDLARGMLSCPGNEADENNLRYIIAYLEEKEKEEMTDGHESKTRVPEGDEGTRDISLDQVNKGAGEDHEMMLGPIRRAVAGGHLATESNESTADVSIYISRSSCTPPRVNKCRRMRAH